MNHVADGAGLVVERRTSADIHGFRGGDLNVIDVLVGPERFEHGVGEPQDEHVAHEFLAEVVVDAVDGILFEDAAEGAIQRSGGWKIVSERLLDDDALPAHVFAIDAAPLPAFQHQTGFIDALDDGFVELRRDREVEQHTTFRTKPRGHDLRGSV